MPRFVPLLRSRTEKVIGPDRRPRPRGCRSRRVERHDAAIGADDDMERTAVGEVPVVGHVDPFNRVRPPMTTIHVDRRGSVAVRHEAIRGRAERHANRSVVADRRRVDPPAGRPSTPRLMSGWCSSTVVHDTSAVPGCLRREVGRFRGKRDKAPVTADVGAAEPRQHAAVAVALHAERPDADALDGARSLRSRTKTSEKKFVSLGTRFSATEANATNRPSALDRGTVVIVVGLLAIVADTDQLQSSVVMVVAPARWSVFARHQWETRTGSTA